MTRISGLSPADLGALLVAAVAATLAARLLVSLAVGALLAMLPRHRGHALRSVWMRHATPLARRLLAVALPVTLSGAGALPASAAVIRRAYGPPWQGSAAASPTAASPTTATSTVAPINTSLPTTSPPSSPPTGPTSSSTASTTRPRVSAPTRHAAPSEHTVERGESFWSIAESHVLTWVDEATERDLSRYWVRLVEANVDRLPVPSNPDLLLPGTVVRLPPLVR